MDTAADSDTVSAWTAQMVLAIVELWVGIVGACQNAVAVEERLVTSVRNLQLLVQAKEAEARENAHADGGDEFLSVRCSGMVQKLVLGGKRNLEERGGVVGEEIHKGGGGAFGLLQGVVR